MTCDLSRAQFPENPSALSDKRFPKISMFHQPPNSKIATGRDKKLFPSSSQVASYQRWSPQSPRWWEWKWVSHWFEWCRRWVWPAPKSFEIARSTMLSCWNLGHLEFPKWDPTWFGVPYLGACATEFHGAPTLIFHHSFKVPQRFHPLIINQVQTWCQNILVMGI